MKKITSSILVMLLAVCAVKAQNPGASELSPRQITNQSATDSSLEMTEAARLNKDFVSLFAQGKYDEALPVAKRVLELREKALGMEHQLVAVSLTNLGVVYIQRKEPAAAKQPLLRALRIYDQNLGKDHPSALVAAENLALVFTSLKEYDKAEELYRRVLATREERSGQNNQSVAPVLLKLGYLGQSRGDADKAIANYSRAFDIYEAMSKPLSDAEVKTLESYECAIIALGRNGEPPNTHSRLTALLNIPRDLSPAEHKANIQAKLESKDTTTGVLNGMALKRPQPGYPDEAKRDGASGVVLVNVVINESGEVISAKSKCGHPALQRAAVAAARKWKFTPTLLSGQPVEVTGSIIFNFTLAY